MEASKRLIILFILFIISFSLQAKPISGHSVVLQVLEKVTARISTIEILVGETAKYGSLEIEIFDCKKRPPEEIPEDFVLLKIMEEISPNNFKKAFQGWMLSSSPAVAPFENPTYDVWVKDCNIDFDSK